MPVYFGAACNVDRGSQHLPGILETVAVAGAATLKARSHARHCVPLAVPCVLAGVPSIAAVLLGEAALVARLTPGRSRRLLEAREAENLVAVRAGQGSCGGTSAGLALATGVLVHLRHGEIHEGLLVVALRAPVADTRLATRWSSTMLKLSRGLARGTPGAGQHRSFAEK